MSMRRAKTPGWAAFDPKKQHKQVTDNDPYPPIAHDNTASQHLQSLSGNGGKSYFSVLSHSSGSPSMMTGEEAHGTSIKNNQSQSVSRVCEKLKVDHPWANENLIEDIVAAVDNDIDRALILLNEMAPPGRLQDKKETELTAKSDGQLDAPNSSGKVLLDDNVTLGLMMDMSMIPVEPEWEDDDVYLIHRKEAIKAMRLASRHSKAASDAYLRRDHAAAQDYSIKAREEWSNAEKLHAKAAKEIFAIRNCVNDDWKLDLHGLHATEAVQVLLEHLLKIESQLSSGTHSTKPDKTNLKVGLETEKPNRQQQLSKPRLLEVITGKGSHSRGEAALPVAIKSFLSENGYYYYEARIGIITVQPKFHKLPTAMSNP